MDYFRNVFKLDVLTGTKALSINPKAHSVETTDIKTQKQNTLEYDKLVIATGASPFVPNLEGKDLKGIFTLNNIPDVMGIYNYILGNKPKNVVVVGAGLIGMEAAENLVNQELKVTILEALGWPLPGLLDYEMAAPVEKQLKARGVNAVYGQRVSGFQGDAEGKVKKVIAGNNGFDADMVIMALGVQAECRTGNQVRHKNRAAGRHRCQRIPADIRPGYLRRRRLRGSDRHRFP